MKLVEGVNKNGGITGPPFLLNAEALIAIFFHCFCLIFELSIKRLSSG
jgi:hypothetical protein